MTNDHEHDHDHDLDRDHDNDNGHAVAAPSGGALTSLQALETALANVNTASLGGRSGLPMLQFKSRSADGTWCYGQKQTILEDGSTWGVDPRSFRWGFVCFGPGGSKALGEQMTSVGKPLPEATALQDLGGKWQQQWAVNMKCVSGVDAGAEVVFKTTTVGGTQAVVALIEAVRERLGNGGHAGKVAPIVRPGKESYQHSDYGRVWNPLMPIVDWMALDGPPPAPKPAPDPTSSACEQPRRRRVG